MGKIILKAEAKSVRRRNGPSTENKILTVAEELFALHGFDAVTTKQLASKAGVAIGAVYHHFPSKEALYAAATKRVFSSKATPPQDVIDADIPPERKISQLVTWFVRLMIEDENFGQLLTREMISPRASTPSFVDDGLFKQPLIVFKGLIHQIEPNANADEAVAAMLALIFGFSNLKGIYSLFPSVRKTLNTPEEIGEYATRIILGGLKA